MRCFKCVLIFSIWAQSFIPQTLTSLVSACFLLLQVRFSPSKNFHVKFQSLQVSHTPLSHCSLNNSCTVSIVTLPARYRSSMPPLMLPSSVMFLSAPSRAPPALSLHIFALSRGTQPQWTMHGPIPASTLMRCSCFATQPLILIPFLFLNVPKDTENVVVLCLSNNLVVRLFIDWDWGARLLPIKGILGHICGHIHVNAAAVKPSLSGESDLKYEGTLVQVVRPFEANLWFWLMATPTIQWNQHNINTKCRWKPII